VSNNSDLHKKRILELLRQHPEGLTIQEIADFLAMHRQTATKYLYELKGGEQIWVRPVGKAVLHYLKKPEVPAR
jgi:predicted transcriptional regulator